LSARVSAKQEVFGVPLLPLTTHEFMQWMMALSEPGDSPKFVTYLNAWCSNVAMRDPEYMQLLQRADGVYADGQAVVWASRLLGRPVPERVNAGDFIVEFCREAQLAGKSMFLLGSAPGVASAAAERFRREVPGLDIRGAESGYFTDGGDRVIGQIHETAPDFLLVGMGVPLQEKWLAQNMEQFNIRVGWCVGALFEYYGEARARAPKWMVKAGLEWAFRLALEPRRLWKRYLVGNAVFLYRVAREWLRS